MSHREADTQVKWALLLIVAFAASLRLPYFWSAFVDGHSFRQVDTAAIARNFYENSFIPFDPQIDWGGRRGYVEAEFPIIPALTAVLYHAFGVHEWLGRVVVLAFAFGLIWATYRLARALDGGPSVALAAAFFVAVSPAAAFFGRVLMPDTPMLFLATLSLLGFVEFSRTGSTRSLLLGSVSLGLACLVKLPAILVAPAIAAAVLWGRGWSVFRDRRVWLAVVVPLAVTAAWYLHARNVFHETGLTFGVSGGESKMYPPSISPGPWPGVFSKWSTRAMLTDFDFYETMFRRFYHFLWMPAGFVAVLLGFVLSGPRARWITFAWLAPMALFVLVMGQANIAHEYYQLPFIVIGAVWFGAAAWPLFDRAWIAEHIGPKTWHRAGLWLVVAALGAVGFYYSGVTRNYYEPHAMAVRALQVGAAVNDITPDNDLAIVVDDYGITSPMVLYFAHLKGWSFDPVNVSRELIDHLRDLGARYFLTTQWGDVQQRPGVREYLGEFEFVPIPGNPGNSVLVDLHKRH